MIFPEDFFKKSFQVVDGKRIDYFEKGFGDPIILLHGNPTSSYLWRNVIPELTSSGRLIAPDLIGHGDFDNLSESDGLGWYTFNCYRYLAGLLRQLEVNRKTILVGHDWGSTLAFY